MLTSCLGWGLTACALEHRPCRRLRQACCTWIMLQLEAETLLQQRAVTRARAAAFRSMRCLNRSQDCIVGSPMTSRPCSADVLLG